VHPTVINFVQRVLTATEVNRADVLEVGSYDVNGSVRPYLERLNPRRYLGVDAEFGPGVDRVVDCEELVDEVAGKWDIVISTEMLEHVRDWQICLEQMVEKVAPDGLLLITTRSPGFGFHPFPEDHWRFTVDEMKHILHALDLEVVTVEDDPGIGCPGVFALAHKPIGWSCPSDHYNLWADLDIPEGRFDA